MILFFILFTFLLPKCCSSTLQVTSKNPRKWQVNRSLFAPFSEGSSAGKAFTPACLIFHDTLVPPKCALLINIHFSQAVKIEVPQWSRQQSQQVCLCVQCECDITTVAISQTNEVGVHQWLVCQISTKDLWSVVTLRGYTESTEPKKLIFRVLSFQLNLLNCFKSPTPTNHADLKNEDLPPKTGRSIQRKKAGFSLTKCLLFMHIYDWISSGLMCLKDCTWMMKQRKNTHITVLF